MISKTPRLLAEWDWSGNDGLDPATVLSTGATYVLWVCFECGYKWGTRAVERSLGRNCEKCSAVTGGLKRRVPQPGRSFLEVHPDLSVFWDPKNEKSPAEHNANSADKVHFICAQGHSVQVRLYSCNTGILRCRRCSRAGTSRWEVGVRNALASEGFPVDESAPKFTQRASNRSWTPDIVLPSWKLIVELDGFFWHGASESTEKDRRKDADFRSWGWTVVHVRAGLPALSPDDLVMIDRNPSVDDTLQSLKAHLASLGFAC